MNSPARSAELTRESLLHQVTKQYLESGDFNGLPIKAICGPEERISEVVKELLGSARVDLEFGDRHPNPHIKAFDPESLESQLAKIEKFGLGKACLYPSPSTLAEVVDAVEYADRPFTARLAYGEPQLGYYCFDLRVLEFYRRDPRYHYWTNDFAGSLSVSDKFYESDEMRESDQVLLQTFGYAYTDQMERSVAVFLRYLSQLSPEHQQIWNAQLLSAPHTLHPDYRRTSMGEWGLGVSVFDAFVEELHQINTLTQLVWNVPLFRQEYRDRERPRQFTFLTRPTSAELNDFVLVLDKMISDNLNHDFFKLSTPTEETRGKGTLAMLEEWIDRRVRLRERQPFDQMMLVFKKIRALRQRPAHALEEDQFDQRYFQEQRWLMAGAYSAASTLRMIFQLHPRTKDHRVPDFLNRTIWLY